jgi:hypothetical protein
MTTTDFIATLALVMSAGALALEVRRWFESSPRLILSVMADAAVFPSANDSQPMLALNVTNRGGAPTIITGFYVYFYPSLWKRLLRKPSFRAAVNPYSNREVPALPANIGVNERWMGTLRYDDQTTAARQQGHLYVGIGASHSNRVLLKKVPRNRL